MKITISKISLVVILMSCFSHSPVFSQDIYQMQQQQLEQERQRQREFEEQQRQTNQQIQNLLDARGGSALGNAVLEAQRQNQQYRNDQQTKRFDDRQQQLDDFSKRLEAQSARQKEVMDQLTNQPAQQTSTGGRYVPPQPTTSSQTSPGYTQERAEEYFENNPPVTSSTRTDRSTVNIDDLDGSNEGGLVINVRDDPPANQPAAPAQKSCGCYQPYYMMDLLGFCVVDSSWSLDNPGKSPPADLYRVEVCRNPDRTPALDEFH